jgi:hypothetical protein
MGIITLEMTRLALQPVSLIVKHRGVRVMGLLTAVSSRRSPSRWASSTSTPTPTRSGPASGRLGALSVPRSKPGLCRGFVSARGVLKR